MRSKRIVAGLVAGVSVTLAPLSPASAQCGYTIEGVQDCGDCTELLRHVDAATAGVREKAGVGPIADQFACTQ